MKLFPGAAALLFFASSASAQVGHLPENSPFRDIEGGQELTLFAGHYGAGTDELGITPRSGPILGLMYQIHVGGPAELIARYGHVSSSREAVDPTVAAADRSLGSRSVALNLFELALGLNLTGMRSYHHLVPSVGFGAGIISCSCTVDKDPYRFGTPFALSFGAGLRYVPGGHYQVRVDLNDYMHQTSYPGAYFVNSTDGTPFAKQGTPKSFWKSNPTLTIGVSRLFF